MNIILTTMVRNESKAFPRLLRSVAPFVRHVALTDTGSTDDTLAVAREVARELGMAIDIRVVPWQDFGFNRTKNLEHGRDLAKTLGDLKESHLLLLDADMEVPVGVTAPQELPLVGMLPQRDHQAVWRNVRTIRADIEARYIGRTHEYLSHSSPVVSLDWFTIIDHCDGGCRADKFERDERLLRMDLAEKGDTRSMHYLAQTLKCLGRRWEAIALYDRRAKFEDFPEEAWMARIEASRLCEGPERDMRALEAFFTRPQRIEPLAEMARRAVDAGKHKLALGLVDMAKGIPFPKDETLYILEHPYKWELPYVESLASYYVGDHERGQRACEYLHLTKGSPYNQLAINNGIYYTKAIEGTRVPIPFTPPEGFAPASPCFGHQAGGWIGVIRAVNYCISPDGYFPLIAGGWANKDRPITTRNFLVCYDDDWRPLAAPVELVAPRGCNPEAQIVGYEDQRIVDVSERVLTTAGVHCDDSPVGQPELWESTWDMTTGRQLTARKLSQGNNIEKNWLPFHGGYLYGHWPVTFVDGDGLNPRVVQHGLNLADFRGSAAPIPYNGGFLYVIHEVGMIPRRTYVHRFIWVKSGRWDDLMVSRPFLLHSTACMESCFSISDTRQGVVLTCAREDKEIYALTVSHAVVKAMIDKGTKA